MTNAFLVGGELLVRKQKLMPLLLPLWIRDNPASNRPAHNSNVKWIVRVPIQLSQKAYTRTGQRSNSADNPILYPTRHPGNGTFDHSNSEKYNIDCEYAVDSTAHLEIPLNWVKFVLLLQQYQLQPRTELPGKHLQASFVI
jgi:hypothetical protein